MALIVCPDCGKEVSDKAECCIHCGCPLKNYVCSINGTEYNLKEELDIVINGGNEWIKAIGTLRKKTSLTLYDGDELIEIIKESKTIPKTFTTKYPLEDREKYNTEPLPKCPICSSTNLKKISSLKKATKISLFGIFGAGDVGKTWQCNNCGSRW